MIVDELIAVLGFDVRGEGELARFNRGIDQAEKNARRASQAMSAMGVAIGSFVGNIAAMAAVRLGDMIGSIPGDVIATGREFQKLETILTTIEGSSDKAKASLAWVEEFAKQTPFDLQQVADGFVRLRAYGLDPMEGLLESVGNASSAMGKSLMQGVEAVADAAQGENERLKEFGVRASVEGDKVTYRWQENGKEMTKTVRKSGTEIVKALAEIFGRFDGAMEAQSKTLDGMLSNLGDNWQNFLRRIGQRGFYADFERRIKGLLDNFEALDKDGSLDRWAQAISDGLSMALNVASTFVERMARNLGTLGELLDSFGGKIGDFLRAVSGGRVDLSNWQSLMVLFGALLIYLRPVWALFAVVALAVDDFLTYLRGGESAIGNFIDALAEFLGADPAKVADVLGKIAAAAGGLLAAAIGIRVFAGAIRSLAGALGLMGSGKVAKGTAAVAAAGDAGGRKNRPGGGLLGFGTVFGAWNAYDLVDQLPDDKAGVEAFLQEGRKRAAEWNAWLEENVGSPSQWLRDWRPSSKASNAGGETSLRPAQKGAMFDVDPRWADDTPVRPDQVLQMLQNFKDNSDRVAPANAAKAVEQTLNDNRTDNRDQSVNLGGVSVVVNGVENASRAVGQAVGQKIGQGAVSAVPRISRAEKDDVL